MSWEARRRFAAQVEVRPLHTEHPAAHPTDMHQSGAALQQQQLSALTQSEQSGIPLRPPQCWHPLHAPRRPMNMQLQGRRRNRGSGGVRQHQWDPRLVEEGAAQHGRRGPKQRGPSAQAVPVALQKASQRGVPGSPPMAATLHRSTPTRRAPVSAVLVWLWRPTRPPSNPPCHPP